MRVGNKKRNGFTLVEVIISMALIVLVGAIVISIITFTNSYNEKNEALSTRTRELTGLRMEIDEWFSAMDDGNNNISTTESGYIVYRGTDGYISVSEDGYSYTFSYGASEESVKTYENLYVLKFANGTDGETLGDESEPVLRFTIEMPVTEIYYICGVYYG